MALGRGASKKGNWLTSPKCKDIIRKITPASELRKISGSVKRGLPAKSFSSYSRMQMPSATRPHRPDRWLAAAWLMGSTSNCSTLLRKL